MGICFMSSFIAVFIILDLFSLFIYMFLHVLTCFGQKSGRPILGVFFKHVVELYSLVKTEHVKLCEVRALHWTIVHL